MKGKFNKNLRGDWRIRPFVSLDVEVELITPREYRCHPDRRHATSAKYCTPIYQPAFMHMKSACKCVCISTTDRQSELFSVFSTILWRRTNARTPSRGYFQAKSSVHSTLRSRLTNGHHERQQTKPRKMKQRDKIAISTGKNYFTPCLYATQTSPNCCRNRHVDSLTSKQVSNIGVCNRCQSNNW